jgi:hypothetical protein
MKVDGLTNDEVKSHLQVSSKQLTQDSFQSQDPVHFVSNLINPYYFECCSDPKANQGGDEGGGLTHDEVKKHLQVSTRSN